MKRHASGFTSVVYIKWRRHTEYRRDFVCMRKRHDVELMIWCYNERIQTTQSMTRWCLRFVLHHGWSSSQMLKLDLSRDRCSYLFMLIYTFIPDFSGRNQHVLLTPRTVIPLSGIYQCARMITKVQCYQNRSTMLCFGDRFN